MATRMSKQTRLEVLGGQGRLGIGDERVYYQPPAQMLPAVDWKPPRLVDMPSWRDAKRVSIDLECKDEDLRALGPGVRRSGSYVVGVSFAIEDGPAHYLPIAHHGGDNCEGDVMSYVRDQLRDFRGILTGAGLGYDIDWLAEHDCPVWNQDWRDVQVLDPLLNELHRRYNLEAICERYGLPGKDETILREAAAAYRVDPKKGLWRLPARYVAQYAVTDARRPLQVLRRQEAKIPEENVEQIWGLERKVTPILVKMRRRGVRIDVDKLDQIERLAVKNESECLSDLYRLTGVRVAVGDVWKAVALEPAVAGCGVRVPRTPKTRAPSIDNVLLEKCGDVGRLILRARKWNKLRTTFAAQVRRALTRRSDGDWRVHCTFNQLRTNDDNAGDGEESDGKGVRYGRLSSSAYNMQQQPSRDDEFGSLWRSVYIADDGARWACLDWSQQEPRIGVHYAELLRLPGAKEFADEYRRNPSLDIHQKLTDLGNEQRRRRRLDGATDLEDLERKIVKNFVNGRLYGMGDTKLCHSFGLPTVWVERYGKRIEVPGPEGQAMIEEFNAFAPWISGLTRHAARRAEERGFVVTILGRVLRFERGPDGKIWKAHKAFNRIGQGSAADQAKATLVEADREGIPIQTAVHDEFNFSYTDVAQPRRLRELMMNVVRFSVPMKVDFEHGDNWGELQKDAA